MPEPSPIPLLEELAANAWPAAVVQVVGGWRLRFNHGVTRRANSVWPNAWSPDPNLEARLALVEAFYARRRLPARFQITAAVRPAGLDRQLSERGYRREAPTLVQGIDLAQLLATAPEDPGAAAASPIRVSDYLDDGWRDSFHHFGGYDGPTAAARLDIMSRIGPEAGFVLAEIDREPAGWGMAVVERGWVGLFGMYVRPGFRGQGLGGRLLLAAAGWALSRGAGAAYLQVEADNRPAQALYARYGFATLYGYHYRRWDLPLEAGSSSPAAPDR